MSPKHKARRRRSPRQSIRPGMVPGAPVFVGEQKLERVRIDVLQYGTDESREHAAVSVEECAALARGPGVTWINVLGIHDAAVIEDLGRRFDLHPLTVEDLVNTTQRPKVEEFPGYLFVVMKMITRDAASSEVRIEHVSLILGERYAISFQEVEGDVFDSVRDRIRTGKGRIRSMQADYLMYTLMDAVVDHYFLAVESIGDSVEDIDDRVLLDPKTSDLQEIHRYKSDLLSLRRAVWPLRETTALLERSASPLIHTETKTFLRDLYDHTIQVIDMVETSRDVLGSVQDTYLSSVSYRMNEVMKVLTIIATIFIPLTFVSGVYGMNFEYMPELQWHWGYPAVLLVMLAISAGLLAYFKRKGWL